jgi:arylsulfatase A-like enzyme
LVRIGCLLLLAGDAAARAAEQPNFVVIFCDDLGYADVKCFGATDIETPAIDLMADQGRRFTHFYVASPTCSPSRAALLTGCYPLRAGFDDAIAVRNDGSRSPSRVLWPGSPLGLHPDEVTVAELLQAAGYATGMVGKWHLGDQEEFNPVRHGFDEYFGVPYSNDMAPYHYLRGTQILDESLDRDRQIQRYTSEAMDFIRRHREGPFFLYLAHTMPHTPLAASREFRGKSNRGAYGDAVAEIDWSVGRILGQLRELGLDEGTLVLFTSDNGPWLHRGENGGLATPLRGGKGSTYEGGVRVPCVMWQPGTVPPGTVCEEIATTMDVLPTFAAMAGAVLPTDRTIDGHNITPLVIGQPDAVTPYEYLLYYFGNELHGVRSGRWKLRTRNHLRNENIYRYDAPRDVFLPAALYDLHRDPGEQKSVLKNHPQIVERLEGYLQAARADLGDSLTGIEPTNIRPTGRVEVAP